LNGWSSWSGWRARTSTTRGAWETGVNFLEFPPVLQLHLRRFEYDFDLDRNHKVNDCSEFPETIDLGRFLPDRRPVFYDLYGVVVHSGTSGSATMTRSCGRRRRPRGSASTTRA
jgi:ubiquitin C-terminal hydrolase